MWLRRKLSKAFLCAEILFTFCLLRPSGLIFAFDTLSPQEKEMKVRWISAKFDGCVEDIAKLENCLEVIENHDPVLLDRRNGKNLQIAGKTYDRGLYCHAPSHINVFLPSPAKRFIGVAGVDTNADATRAGNGSVRFRINVGEQELFATNLLRGDMPGVEANVELNGSMEFALIIDDGGDGISCDQSDWADARVELEDGSTLFLSDLPLVDNTCYDRTLDLSFPFSFTYDGVSSKLFLDKWSLDRKISEQTNGKITRTLTFTEPNGRLQAICTAVDYIDYPFVEWTLRFKNLSDTETPVIEDVKVIDAFFGRDYFEQRSFNGWDAECGEAARWNRQHEFKLHYSIGSPCRADDYMPHELTMTANQKRTFVSDDGRPTGAYLPYFNLESFKRGWIVVLGWSGQWSATFDRSSELETHVCAGQELTHFKLLPKEEVRSPIAVVGPWFRDTWYDAQNVWRRWMIEFNVPRIPTVDGQISSDGKIIASHLAACSSHYFSEMTRATSDDQIEFIRDYLKRGIQLDYWWMDAGWYPCGGNWAQTGTWEVDQGRFPGGLRKITDFGRSNGVETIVWFEPERVESGSWLAEHHPEWLLGRLLNLGKPEAREWLINRIDGILKEEGIDFYRQDYNIGPVAFWRAADAPDRQGITEIRYVEGYLAYWDALLARNPRLRIDTCASGGRRNDLETLRRSVPLLRSDYLLEPTSQQVHSYGVALWIPFFGTGSKSFDDYKCRSMFVPYLNLCYDIREDREDWNVVVKNLNIWRKNVAPYYMGDYYPLTSVSLESDAWIGWQYNDEEKGEGVVQMFVRHDSKFVSGRFPLHGLDSSATYEIRNADADEVQLVGGGDLMEKGLLININSAPYAAVINYKKLQ